MPACTNCGKDVSPLAVACPACGHPGPAPQRNVIAVPAVGTYEPWSVAALASGIAGLSILPVIASIAAIVFGHIARGNLRADPTKQGAGFATAGLVLGWIGVGVAIFFALIFFVFLGLFVGSIPG